jgi:hypothetical protein
VEHEEEQEKEEKACCRGRGGDGEQDVAVVLGGERKGRGRS